MNCQRGAFLKNIFYVKHENKEIGIMGNLYAGMSVGMGFILSA
jgi:hypothetical protein